MNDRLKILYCSPEVTPFSKTGGLADVSGSLPKALAEIGCDTRVITPRYRKVTDSPIRLRKIIDSLSFSIGPRTEECELFEGRLPDSDVPVYFVSNDRYFNRKGLYQEDGKDYEDNLERFSFFSMAVLYSIRKLGWAPDIIHCNDWQTSLIPVYLKTLIVGDKPLREFYKGSRTILTIHNLGYQGLFEGDKLHLTGLDERIFTIHGLEYYGKINLLKGGIIFSDILTTVSPTYSREIQTEEGGCGLEGVLRERGSDLYGILNGVDYSEWDPSIDEHIVVRYGLDSLDRKKICKKDLQKTCGLEIKDIPLIGMISRLDTHKGMDILIEIMDELMHADIQMVILGTGKPEYEEILKRLARKYVDKLSVNLFFDTPLAHKIEAGSDILLIPSKYEPCGLNQLYSFRYGTIPLAHKTGGLADTITDYIPSNIVSNRATGFLFYHYSAEDFLQALLLALAVYEDVPRWNRLMMTGMEADFSWKRSAGEYVKLYEKVLKKVRESERQWGEEEQFLESQTS